MSKPISEVPAAYQQEMNTLQQQATDAQARGDLDGAATYFEALHAVMGRHLGFDHPTTLRTLCRAIDARADLGEPQRLDSLVDGLIANLPQAYDAEHQPLLQNMHNLAGKLLSRSRVNARKILQRVIDGKIQVLGLDDPSTLTSQSVMTVILMHDGDIARAKVLAREVYEARERVLGIEHPDTLRSMGHVAAILVQTGQREAARSLTETVLRVRQAVLGPEHPETLISMNNLADTMNEGGERDTAIDLYKNLLAIQKRVLGLDHPETKRVHNRIIELGGEVEEKKGILSWWRTRR